MASGARSHPRGSPSRSSVSGIRFVSSPPAPRSRPTSTARCCSSTRTRHSRTGGSASGRRPTQSRSLLTSRSQEPSRTERGRTRGAFGTCSCPTRETSRRQLMGARSRRTALLCISLMVAAGASLAAAEPVASRTWKTIAKGTLEEPNQKTAEISTDELRRILADGSAVVFDARPPKEYAISHIPGALNVSGKPGLPMSQYVPDAGEIERALGGEKESPIVLYCSGPFCGRSKGLSEELLAAGFTNVRRYQLGIPVWRALGGATQIELEGVAYVHEMDRSAVFIDARDPEDFQAVTVPRAINVPAMRLEQGKDVGEVRRAKDDGRLPMEDHNTRIIVFGRDTEQARAVAEAIIGEAFHNVAFYGGTFESLSQEVK